MKTKITQCALFLLLTLFSINFQHLWAGVVTYGYDSGGRLIAASYGNGRSQTFSYDSAGNLLQNRSLLPGGSNDTDGDSLDDNWEQTYFGNLSRDGNGDFDGDGFIDRNEFLAGTNPASATSLLYLFSAEASGGSATIQWASVSGKTYRVQFKTDLGALDWTNLPGDVTASGATASKTDNLAPSQRYYRVMLVP